MEEYCEECKENQSDEEEERLTERISDIYEVRCWLIEAADTAVGIVSYAHGQSEIASLERRAEANSRVLLSAESRARAILREIATFSSGDKKLIVREKEIDELERRFGQIAILIEKIDEET